jgi:glycosyltransferase involved in cell wall biosynthesis
MFCALLKGLSYFKPTIVTIHSGSFNEGYRQLRPRLRGRLIAALQRCIGVIVVNEVQKSILVKEGIAQERVHVVPAFLPPVHETYSLPHYIASQLQGRELIVTSGYGLYYYGFHTLLDALAQLSLDIAERVALVVGLYTQYDAGYVEELERRAFHSAVPCIITRDLRPEHFADILRRGRIYVRATDRDGDAVALREAAYFGLQIIASDCVPRPVGSVLFSTNESSMLADKVEAVWHDKGLGLVQFDPTVGLRNLMSIYQTL